MMHDAEKDVYRSKAAAAEICDGRHPEDEYSKVLITLDHTIAIVLLAAMGMNARKAVQMLNEGLLPRVEDRIMLFEKKTKAK